MPTFAGYPRQTPYSAEEIQRMHGERLAAREKINGQPFNKEENDEGHRLHG